MFRLGLINTVHLVLQDLYTDRSETSTVTLICTTIGLNTLSKGIQLLSMSDAANGGTNVDASNVTCKYQRTLLRFVVCHRLADLLNSRGKHVGWFNFIKVDVDLPVGLQKRSDLTE